ncbi:tyrosine-type recombinase/integrase [Sorangium sp. So ce693]|uniref:tyrosine-type recombinase/integrase n=1 Tax=Sorangium sp. So ce693 TaxID=3133318 RepID=UPI003F612519
MARASTGYMRLIGGVWHVRLSKGSGASRERPWYSLGTSDKRVAEQRRKQLVAQRAAGIDPAKAAAAMPEVMTVTEFAATWNAKRKAQEIVSARDDEQRIRDYALPRIGAKLLGDVRPTDIEAIFDDVVLAGRSKETLHHVRAGMGRLFKAAWRAGLVTESPVDKAELPKVREVKLQPVILTDDEVVHLLEHLGRRAALGDGWRAMNASELRAMCACARILGGMRTSDVNRWDWLQLDLIHFAHVVVPRSKTETPQDLAVPQELRPILRDWWERAGRPTSGPVFPVRRGQNAGGFKAQRGTSYADRLRRECRRAGIERTELYKNTSRTRRLDFHGFRRAFASALANAPGVTMQTAMKLTAHSDPRTHLGYVAGVTEIPAAVVPRLPGSTQSVGSDWPLATARGQSSGRPSKTALSSSGLRPPEPKASGSNPLWRAGFSAFPQLSRLCRPYLARASTRAQWREVRAPVLCSSDRRSGGSPARTTVAGHSSAIATRRASPRRGRTPPIKIRSSSR